MSCKRPYPFITGLFLSFVTLVGLLGGLELAGYLWERSTAEGPLGWTLVGARRLDLQRHGTPDRPYHLFEPFKEYRWRGTTVHINSHGLRTEEFATPKPSGTFRVLNVGDSIVFGWEVRQEDTYGKQLERKLNGRADRGQYEVINAGIPGWNPDAERNFLLHRGLEWDPDLVVLGVTIVNDTYGTGPEVSENPNVFNWLRDHTHGWPFLTSQARFLLSRQRGPEAIPVLNPPREAEAYFPLDENDPAWDRLWGPIGEMQRLCQERGIRFIVVVFPTAFQLNSVAHPDVPQRVLAQRAAAAGVELLDLLPIYRQTCQSAGGGACDGYNNLLFADVWMHPTPLGHRLAAEALGGI